MLSEIAKTKRQGDQLVLGPKVSNAKQQFEKFEWQVTIGDHLYPVLVTHAPRRPPRRKEIVLMHGPEQRGTYGRHFWSFR